MRALDVSKHLLYPYLKMTKLIKIQNIKFV